MPALAIILMAAFCCKGQTPDVNVLLQKLETAKRDTDKVNLYYTLSKLYWNKNTDSTALMAQKSLDLALKINFEKGVALAYLSKGIALVSAEKYPEALNCFFKTLRIGEKLDLTELAGNAYNIIGTVYSNMGNFSKAIFYFKESLGTGRINYGANKATSSLLINIGDLYKKNNEFDSAIAYTSKGLEIDRKALDSLGMAIALFNLGETYIKKKMYDKATPFLNESWLISKRINDTEGLAFCNNAFALILYNKGDYAGSIKYARVGFDGTRNLGINEVQKSSYNLLYLNYLKLNDYQKALEYRNLEIALSDSLNTIERDRAIKNVVADYDLEKKQNQIDLLQKDKEIKQKEFNSIKARRNVLRAGTLLMALVSFFLFTSYKEKKSLSKQLEKQNTEMLVQNKKLEELNRLKNKLFSIVSHDLRGPVGSVKSMMDLMQSGVLPYQESEKIIPKLSDSLLQTSHLLDNLLYWAKSQMNGIQVNAQHFDMLRVVNQNIGLIQGRANQKRVSVRMNETAEVLWAYGDEAMTDIVIRNLLENAVKFSRAGEVVTVHAEKGNAFITVYVSDSGKGIPYEHQLKIFNKLTAHTTFGTASEKGSGLGLLLCKELVENNGGEIWFESKPEQGSTFSFTVPVLKKNNEPSKGIEICV